MQVSSLFVILMGMGVTFVGLTSLILLVTLMGKVCGSLSKKSAVSAAEIPAAPAVDKKELVAVVSAALAEELGTEVSALRIVSMKQVA